jgi:ADP-heptose:LPS heptosyltransferase
LSAFLEILKKLHPRRFEKRLKHAVAAVLAFLLPQKRVTGVPLDSIRNVLVVRQHNQLGDMLCAVPLLRALRERLPTARIDLVASPVNYEVMLRNPYVDEVLLYDKLQLLRSPHRLLRFFRALRTRGYDLTVVPSTVSMSFTSDAMALISGAKYRVGAGSIDGVENITSHFFNLPLDLSWEKNQAMHQTERNLEYVRCLGINTEDLSLTISLNDEERKLGERFYSTLPSKKPLAVGFHPGAGKERNRWPADYFSALANRLAERCEYTAIIIEGPADQRPTRAMRQGLKLSHTVLSGRPIREVAAVLERLNLLVTNDTGIMHVAGALKVPVLALFGPTNPLEWAPPGGHCRWLRAHNGDFRNLSVDVVLEAATSILFSAKRR